MSRLSKIIEISFVKSFRINFKYLPFRQAIRFPILVSRHCRLRTLKGKVEINSSVQCGMIKIGFDSVGLFDNRKSRSIWHVNGRVVFEGTAFLGHGSKICVSKNATVFFGNNFTVTAETALVATNRITFGRDCLLSWNILVMDSDWHRIFNENNEQINPSVPIEIGNHVWIGCRTCILKGVSIADGCVIAAGSMVAKSLEKPDSVYGKNPLKLLKTGIYWQN